MVAADGPFPASLGNVVDGRLAGLGDDVLALLERVELLYERRVTTVLAVAGADGLLDALDAAVAAGVLEVADDRVVFTHPLLATAVHGMTGPARRAALHRRLAELAYRTRDAG